MRCKKQASEKFYIMMNKAHGTVCSTVSDRRHTVYEEIPESILVSPEGVKLHTVGRLDADTTGLLLLTNDGKFSNYLTRPENKIQKTYEVTLRESVDFQNQKVYVQKAEAGIELPPEKKAPVQKSGGALIEWSNTEENKCRIILTEGKFHEVKRIFRALGNEVIELKRIEMGGIRLDENLKEGQWRFLQEDEIKRLSC